MTNEEMHVGNIILRRNATPVYSFLSLINTLFVDGETAGGKKILDCGAGGPLPPLALFRQHGFETWGIDVSDKQLARARTFCKQHQLEIRLDKGDMRQLPFEDQSFDYVYEHYSMCHLSKSDTARAISEMFRVLKKGGLCFLGVISSDSWPKSMYGQERTPGEFWTQEDGDDWALHSMFDDDETDLLVSSWDIIRKTKQVSYQRAHAASLSPEEWLALYPEAPAGHSLASWQERYGQRVHDFQYVHTYLFLKKLG